MNTPTLHFLGFEAAEGREYFIETKDYRSNMLRQFYNRFYSIVRICIICFNYFKSFVKMIFLESHVLVNRVVLLCLQAMYHGNK